MRYSLVLIGEFAITKISAEKLSSLPICVIMIRMMKMDKEKELPQRKHPRPTITDIVCAYKSLTTRECKKNGFDGKLFQTSFYEHIIRGREDYEEIVKYIYENPIRWYYDE